MPAADEVLTVEARLIDSVTAGLGKIGKTAVKIANRMVTSFQKVSASVMGVGKSLFNIQTLLAGAGLLVGFQKTVGAAAEFNSQMAEAATLSEEVSNNIGTLSNEILDLSAQSGEGIDTLTSSLYNSISAGVEASDVMQFLNTSTRLAIGGATDTAIAVDGLTTILNGYSMETKQAADVSDAFFVAMKFGKTTVGELASGIGPLVPTAKAAGLAFDEMLGAVSALTKAGFQTPRAITAMQGALVSINSLTPETKTKMDNLGLSYKITGEEGKTFIDILNNISKAGGGTLEGVKELIPNIEGVKGILALTSKEGENFIEVMKLMGDRQGETAKAYEKMTNTFEFKSKRIKQSFETAFIEVGNQLMPLFDDMADGILNNMDSIKMGIAVAGAVVKDTFNVIVVGIETTQAIFITAGATISNVLRQIVTLSSEVVNAIFKTIDSLPGSLIPDSWIAALDDFKQNQVKSMQDNTQAINSAWSVVADTTTKINEEGLATVNVFKDMDKAVADTATSMDDLSEKEKGLLGIGGESAKGETDEEKAAREQQAQDIADFMAMQEESTLAMKKDANDKMLAEHERLKDEELKILNEKVKEEDKLLKKQKADKEKLDAAVIKSKQHLTDTLISEGSRGLQAMIGDEKEAKKIALVTSIIQGALAVQKALASAPPPANFFAAAAVGVQTAVNSGIIASQAFREGGFPKGRNAIIQVNEEGQEAVLNAGAVSRLGVGNINALNNGTQVVNKITNQITFSPSITQSSSEPGDPIDMMGSRLEQFSELIVSAVNRGFLKSKAVGETIEFET